MSRGGRKPPTEAGSFADVAAGMDGLRRLEGGRAPRATPRRANPRRVRVATTFHFPDPGEPLLGVASGIQASQLRRLRDGRIPPDERVDLHGLISQDARRLLIKEVRRAADAGARCLLVIHGKGLRSSGRPVLQESLAAWLGDPQLEDCVLAFAPAVPSEGGRGASYVLLRRRR